jgi:ribonucleoside-diphosphate reductase beta chain
MSKISTNIFNSGKTDYEMPPLFLGEAPGLFDSINKHYPKIWELYKTLKKSDWDENDFSFISCNVEFKTCPKPVYDMMIRTLAWQWQADSIASRSLTPIVAPFVSSSELWAMWGRVADNEVVHALTYSEIVRSSFDYPDKILADIVAMNDSMSRANVVADVMEKTYQTSHKLSLGLVEKNQETYNDIFMFVVGLYALERIQFMASFAVTFAIAETGMFLPIAKAVQKICNEEYKIHAPLDKVILDYELRTSNGLMAFTQCKPLIQKLLDEVVQVELDNVDALFSEGRELVGVDADLLKQWVLFNAKEPYTFFGLQAVYPLPEKNPMHFMESWMDIDSVSISPQEERGGAYLVGGFSNDDEGAVYEMDL